jgi:hypothetical protein
MNVIERAHIERFRSIISERLGLQFEDEKLDMLADVLRQRLQAQGKKPRILFQQFGSESTSAPRTSDPCLFTHDFRDIFLSCSRALPSIHGDSGSPAG